MSKVLDDLNQLRFNSSKSFFRLSISLSTSEIRAEFNIFRSTAIPDINEIETMGVLLVFEAGRSGGYFVMANSFLPAIRFTTNQVKAFFIAFMATRNQQLSYLSSQQSLTDKLIGLIPENQQDDLVHLNQILLFEGTNPYNPDLLDLSDLPHPTLEKLIQTLLINRYLTLTVCETDVQINVKFYLIHLYKETNSWNLEGLDLVTKKKRIIPEDDLQDITVLPCKNRLSLNKTK